MKRLAAVLFLVLPLAAPALAGPKISFGIHTPQENTTWEDLVATWQEAERLGFESAWLYDHFIPIAGDKDGPVLEGWTALAALATKTEKIRIGVLVTGNTYRNPALLAKMATTVDHLSRGRLEFGIGAAWEEHEHRAYGIPFHTARERAERLGEALEVITRLWNEEKPSFEGEYYSLHEAEFAPPPVQKPHPPIVIGGKGKQWIMPLVGRYADEWNIALGVTPEGVRERMEIVRAACEEAKRSGCVERVSAFFPLISITNVPLAGPLTRLGARFVVEKRMADSILAGSAASIRARIAEYVGAGADRVIVSLRPPYDHDLMREFAEEVMPAFSGEASAAGAEGK